MVAFTEISKLLREFGVVGCHVRSKDIIAFSTQKWEVDDSLEPRDTMMFFYYPDEEKAEQWAASEWDRMTGIHGCACFAPEERWVFVADPGEVYVVGQGDDGDEKPITRKKAAQFSAVKCVAGQHAYAVGTGREVYRRTRPDKWEHLSDKTLLQSLPKDLDHAGFEDIDGFSERDIYACGGRGDLWWFDGRHWTAQELPTDADLERLLCASDGQVYITTNQNALVVGRANQWRVIELDLDGQMLQEIVSYGSRILISTDDTVFELVGEALQTPAFGLPSMTTYTHLAAGDGILVVAGDSEAFLHDGKRWSKIFQF